MTYYHRHIASWLSRRVFVCTMLIGVVASLSAFQSAPNKHPVNVYSLILEDDRGNVAYMHGSHWHGSMRVPPDGERKFNIYYVETTTDSKSHNMPTRDDWKVLPKGKKYEIAVTIEEDSVVGWTPTSVSGGTLKARVTDGRTKLIFKILHKKKEIYTTAPIWVRVQALKSDSVQTAPATPSSRD